MKVAQQKEKQFYMAVTADEYELPLCIGHRSDMAQFLGKTKKYVDCIISKGSATKYTGRGDRAKVVKLGGADA